MPHKDQRQPNPAVMEVRRKLAQLVELRMTVAKADKVIRNTLADVANQLSLEQHLNVRDQITDALKMLQELERVADMEWGLHRRF